MSKMDYRRLYQDVMRLDPKIRLVTIGDIDGRVMHNERRECERNLLTQKKVKNHLSSP